jgi:hypothetical protein
MLDPYGRRRKKITYRRRVRRGSAEEGKRKERARKEQERSLATRTALGMTGEGD